MTTTVVDLHETDDFDLYIGRQHRWGRRPLPRSIWANPFKPNGAYTLRDALDSYESFIRTSPALMARLPELRGLRLGCWCVNGGLVAVGEERCHGQVLIRLLAEMETVS